MRGFGAGTAAAKSLTPFGDRGRAQAPKLASQQRLQFRQRLVGDDEDARVVGRIQLSWKAHESRGDERLHHLGRPCPRTDGRRDARP
jgi:hypothetical protein